MLRPPRSARAFGAGILAVALLPLGPAFAQAPSAAPSPSAVPAPSSAAPQASTMPSAGPQPQTSTVPSATGAQPAAAAQPQSSAQPATAGAQDEGLPPPPVPAVLPAVPSFPSLSAPLNAIPNPELVGVAQPFVGIRLQDALVMALQRNTELAVSQANRLIANYQIVAAKGAYDVNFQLVPSYSHVVTPVLSPFNTTVSGTPVTTDTAGVTTQLRGLTGSGGQYTVGVTGQRVTSDSAYNSYNPYYETALQLMVTQPLARGLAIDQPRLQIALARANAAYDTSDTLLQASNTVVQVENTYYDLVAAWQNVGIQEEGLRNATAQADSNRRLAARGAVAPTDIVEANTQVNVFQDNVFAAIQSVQRAQTALKSLILANPGDPVWFANLVPTTPVAQVPNEPALDALITSAIQKRPEIAEVRAQRTRSEVNLDYARDQLLPQVDAAIGYTSNGFAGNPLNPLANPLFGLLAGLLGPGGLAKFPTPPSYQTGKLGQAWQNAFDNRFPDINAQLTVSIPIGEHTARANYAVAQLQQRQMQLNETAVVQRIRSEAVNAIQGLREAQYRVIAARAARAAAQRVLLGEQRRFAAGTSTTFLVLQRQLDVATNEGRELQAQTDLDKAIVELNRVSGDIFAQNGIDVTSAGASSLQAAGMNTILPAPTVTLPPGPAHH
jgi:HAE1 family hydrophobic/amphiphilic exporter-1